MNPSIEELKPFVNNMKAASEKFEVCERTIYRWMKNYGLYKRRDNYGSKLNMQKAQKIRQKYKNGIRIKDIAKEYGVTFSTISRILHGITYRIKETACVKVIYNP